MSFKPDGHAHGREGHRPANHRPALVVVLGLCLSCLLWSLTGFHGARKSSGSKRKISEESLEELAWGLALRGGRLALEPPSAGWAAASRWGPTARPSTRGGKYVITAAAEVVPERLNVLAASLRRWSPGTKLVLFSPEGSGGADFLAAAGVEVIPYQLPNNTALDMHRFELYRGYLEALLERDSQAGVVLAGAQDLLVQSDPWCHPLVQRLLDEDALLFTLEGGKAVGDVPLKALPRSQQLMEACFGAVAAKEMASVPVSSAGLTIGGVGAALKYVSQLLQTARAAASPRCRLEGSDQAVHNFLLHGLGPAGNLSFAWHVRRNWESPVHATGYGWPLVVDKDGVLGRVEGDAPPIVYQYENAKGAAEMFRALYPVQPARSTEWQWDGPECMDGAQLGGVKPCPPPKDDKIGSSKPAPAAGSTAAPAAAAPAGKPMQQKAQGKPSAASADAGAAAKKSGDGKDRRRLRN